MLHRERTRRGAEQDSEEGERRCRPSGAGDEEVTQGREPPTAEKCRARAHELTTLAQGDPHAYKCRDADGDAVVSRQPGEMKRCIDMFEGQRAISEVRDRREGRRGQQHEPRIEETQRAQTCDEPDEQGGTEADLTRWRERIRDNVCRQPGSDAADKRHGRTQQALSEEEQRHGQCGEHPRTRDEARVLLCELLDVGYREVEGGTIHRRRPLNVCPDKK